MHALRAMDYKYSLHKQAGKYRRFYLTFVRDSAFMFDFDSWSPTCFIAVTRTTTNSAVQNHTQ